MENSNSNISKVLNDYINSMIQNYTSIPEARKSQLEEIAKAISDARNNKNEVNLTFICTHNSRRSIIAQLWADAAAKYFNLSGQSTYSGGTEATAFNQRSVKAMRKVGFEINMISDAENPVYHTKHSDLQEPIVTFSKKYGDLTYPQSNFIAIMVCSDADQGCPVVLGASKRFSLPYEDPKMYDDTEFEELKYDERVKEIGTEIFFMYSLIKQ